MIDPDIVLDSVVKAIQSINEVVMERSGWTSGSLATTSHLGMRTP